MVAEAYANKTKESITSQKLGSKDLWQFANRILNKYQSAIPHLFNSGTKVLSFASDKVEQLAENFSKNSNLDHSVISFFSRTNVKIHISVTPKMVKIRSYQTLMHQRHVVLILPIVGLISRFLDCLIGVALVFKYVGERSTVANYCPCQPFDQSCLVSLVFFV